jgi:outer membrane receptor protein involved in Fe transport
MATDSTACAVQSGALQGLLSDPNPLVKSLATSLIGLTCANSVLGGRVGGFGVDGDYHDQRTDKEWTGTAVISYKATDRLLTYLSWSRGFKAGGYNLDRAGLTITNAQASQLRFAAEKVDAWELGAKYRGRGFRLGATAFYQMFDNFQLNTFNGVSFVVENIQGCSALDGGDAADSDLSATNGTCAGKNKSGVVSKGVELEAAIYPLTDVTVEAGYTYAHTGYRHNITGAGGRGLTTSLFQLPGASLSNAPRHVVTGSMTWTPPIGLGELRGLIHVDGRYQSAINVGSDLLPEKAQKAFSTVNARLGISGKDNAWNLEFWAQNLFDVNYKQTVAGAPIQGSGSLATVAAGGTSPGNALFIAFPGEPRTYGVTVRTKF